MIQKLTKVNFRSICTYGRARTCVLSVGLAAFLYNIPRFMEVTWDSSFLNESSNDENVTEVCVVSTTLRNNSIYIRCYLEFFLGAYKGVFVLPGFYYVILH